MPSAACSARGVLRLRASGLVHDGDCSLIERCAVRCLGEAGAILVLLKGNALEEERVAIEMNVNQRELPERRGDLLLLDGERAALLQAAEKTSSEGDVVDQRAWTLRMRCW